MVVSDELQFARAAADRVVFMDHGGIGEQGRSETVFGSPKQTRTREFVSRISRH